MTIDVLFTGAVVTVCTPTPGAADYFDLTVKDSNNSMITLRRIPRKAVANLGLGALHGMAANNPVVASYKHWHGSI